MLHGPSLQTLDLKFGHIEIIYQCHENVVDYLEE